MGFFNKAYHPPGTAPGTLTERPAEMLRNLGELFDLHPLAMEDVMNSGQRPKLDSYDD